MTRRELLLALGQLVPISRHGDDDLFRLTAKVSFMDHEITNGIASIALLTEPKTGAGVTIMGDTDLPVIHWLRKQNQKFVAATLAAA